jgi:co-chaperonin GroES (HSP10)
MLRPILHRVIVSPDPVEEISAGGIVLSIDPKKERLAVERGVIVSHGDTAFTGDFKTEHPPAVGDKVYYAKFAGKIIKDSDNVEYLILNDEDVIAVIT